MLLSESNGMFEILIRIESLCSEGTPAALLVLGLLVLMVGIPLWLDGLYFSGVIVTLTGAVAGLFCGWFVSGWLNTSVWVGMAIGVFIFTLSFVVFKKSVMILLSTLIFALSGGTAYAGLILYETPSPETFSQFNASILQPLSQIEIASRDARLNPTSEEDVAFSERLRRFVMDIHEAVSPHQWEIILVVVLGGVVGLLLSWMLRRPIMAVCFSGVGTLLVLVGLEVILLTLNVHPISRFQGRQALLSILYLSLVGIGVIFQFVLLTSTRRKKISRKG